MSKPPRRTSSIGIYHVILRGNNKQRIFEEQEDYRKFLFILGDYRSVCGYSVLAYCVMSNHIHLVIKPGKSSLGNIFQHIGARFVRWYNKKYNRVGHLFQSSFLSKPINNYFALISVIRYVHQNPVKAAICKSPYMYAFSSFSNYFDNELIDSKFMLSVTTKEYFYWFSLLPNSDKFMDIDEVPMQTMTDEKAVQIMKKVSGCRNTNEFQMLDRKPRDKALGEMLAAGISIRRTSRVTGISYTVIWRIQDKAKKNKGGSKGQG